MQATLPPITDSLEQAEQDIREHGICFVSGMLTPAQRPVPRREAGWYTRPIYRAQENWFLSLNPRILEGASDELLTLLGYKTDGLGKVNGRSPR